MICSHAMQQHVAMKEAGTLLHHANLGRAGLTAPVAGHVSAQVPLPGATRTRVLVGSAPPGSSIQILGKKEFLLAGRSRPRRGGQRAPPNGEMTSPRRRRQFRTRPAGLGGCAAVPAFHEWGACRRRARGGLRGRHADASATGSSGPRGRAVAAACAVAVAVALAHVSTGTAREPASERRLALVLLIIGILCAAMRVWASVMPTYGRGAQGVRMRTCLLSETTASKLRHIHPS